MINKIFSEVMAAENRIRKFIRKTPLEFSSCLSNIAESNVYLKLENLQLTGSFKVRGALNKLLSLNQSQREKGVITASSGNHGLAVAYMLEKLAVKGNIFLPANTSTVKIEALRQYKTDLKLSGNDCVQAENLARITARKKKQVYISPYNDLKIIGGQGTIGKELLDQLDKLDAILVPVGGGGLISGIGGFIKSKNRDIEITGCQPENSAVMYESLKKRKILDIISQPTISDGTAGGIEPGAITFEICQEIIDDFTLVTESEIISAIKLILKKHHMLIEGAAALSVASFLKKKQKYKNKTICLIISGCRISPEILETIQAQ